MIKVETKIELEGFRCPITSIATRPMVGDYILCYYFAQESLLKVQTITHILINGEPGLRLELIK